MAAVAIYIIHRRRYTFPLQTSRHTHAVVAGGEEIVSDGARGTQGHRDRDDWW